MTITHLPSTYWEVLKNTNDQGVISWKHPAVYIDRNKIPDRTEGLHEYRVALSDYMFGLLPYWMSERSIMTSRRFMQKLNPTMVEDMDEDDIVVLRANVCPLFGLPGEQPKEEIESISKLFNKIKSVLDWFIEVNPDNIHEARCQIFNNSYPLNQYESIEFKWDHTALDVAGNTKMVLATCEVRDLINSDRYMRVWMKYVRRLQNAAGANAWYNFKQDDFYESHTSPSHTRFHRLFSEGKLPKSKQR
jgi:hypothetical protein